MNRTSVTTRRITLAAALLGAVGSLAVIPAATLADDDAPRGVGFGTGFTYQGRLIRNDVPGVGQFDMQFRLFTASAGGVQVGSTITVSNVAVTEGLFTVNLDFGDVFNGSPRFLAIAVRPAGVGAYTGLTPRQELRPTPHAIYAEQGGSVRNLQDAYDGGNTIITDAGNVVIEGPGSLQFGTTSDPVGDIEIYFPSMPFIATEIRDHAGLGGSFSLYRGSLGLRYMRLEPDVTTNTDQGAWFELKNQSGGSGVLFDSDGGGDGGLLFSLNDSAGGLFAFDPGNSVSNNRLRVPNNSIGAAEILDEPGIAHNHVNVASIDLPSTVTSFGSRSITVPGPGYVVAIGTAELFCDSTANFYQLGVSSSATAFEDGLEFLQDLPAGVAFDSSSTVQSVFNVATAGTYTYHFVGNSSPANSATVSDWSFTLIYVPTAYGTVAAMAPEFPNLNDKQAHQLTGPRAALSPAEIAAEVAQSKADNQARLERELAELQLQLDALRRRMESDNNNSNGN